MRELEKVYDPKEVESKIYKMWEDGGYFTAYIDPDKKPFTIVIPPPNVTGQLHLGHAFDNTIQDILIRYKRMQGFPTLWMPGTDHAGIATQARVEEDLRVNEGLSRFDLGREKFLERVWDWKHKYGNLIVEQLKRLGSSCDWSRERFTMDEGCSKAVLEVFVSLYEKGLIYKGVRIINWCPKCTTALSDIEVEHEEKDGKLYCLLYPIKDSDEKLTIATTRPETMLGDTAVAVNPKDKRYTHLVGKTVILPLVNREIPIIADDYVDMEFGTGCVKITPMHDPNDFEIGERHGLERVLIMDGNAKIINSGKYDGLDRYDARREVLSDLEKLGLRGEDETHKMNIGTCQRCGTVVEPVGSAQWFVKMRPLAEDAIRVVKDGTIKFVPERFSKVYIHWMENVRDWCISRQLWWGHRIPAWYCDCGHTMVSREIVERCEKCGSKDIRQDEDVLDTWFSSALWPFSTLGWPEKTPELDYFYPTDVLSTGYDIIFFWVARMIFSGMENMKREPFHTVLIHGMIRDSQGRKMSKSLGNGIDPLEIIDSYGADALRFFIVTGNSPGTDMRYYQERCEAMRNFANKIWNAARFVMMNLALQSDNPTAQQPVFAGLTRNPLMATDKLELEDKWILSKLNTLAGEVNVNLDKYELGIAAQKLYDFIWDDFCDWYIELAKPRLAGLQQESGQEQQESGQKGLDGGFASGGGSPEDALAVLVNVLTEFLTLLHPFMPFITEEIYQAIYADSTEYVCNDMNKKAGEKAECCQSDSISGSEKTGETGSANNTNVETAIGGKTKIPPLMLRPYPKFNAALSYKKEEEDFESVKNLISAVRSRRAELSVPPSKKSTMYIVTKKTELFETGRAYIGRLAYASELKIYQTAPSETSKYVTAVTDDAMVYLPLSELVDLEKERERILKEIEKVKNNIKATEQKLSNTEFTSKAPEKVVRTEREKLEKYNALLENLQSSLADL